MKKLEVSVECAKVAHGAVEKRLGDLSTSSNQAGQEEMARLLEAHRELGDALTKHNLRPQDG